ncbi:MAG: hypothetical protein KC619_03295 [Myxococcales bacterium]|nr:hypothetical protein [Myxococcales bacterium]
MPAHRIVLALGLLTAACGPGYPDRTSPEAEPLVLSGLVPGAIDPRTGVSEELLLDEITGHVSPGALRRFTGTTFETITPPLPVELEYVFAVRWFEDGAWVHADRGAYHLEGGAWVAYDVPDCDPASGGTELWLQDARASNDAWATIRDDDVLCHWDGTAWTAERLGFQIEALAALPAGLIVRDVNGRIRRRAHGATDWEVLGLGRDAWFLEVSADDTATVGLDPDADGVYEELSIDFDGMRPHPQGQLVGPDGRAWILEGEDSTHESCSYNLLLGRRVCHESTDWVQWVLYRVDGDTRTEVAHLNLDGLEEGSGIWVELQPFVPDGIGLGSGSGKIWVVR